MKSLNKNGIKLISLLLCILFFSCSETENFKNFDTISLNQNYINDLKIETENKSVEEVLISDIRKPSFSLKSTNNESITISTESIDLQNLNNTFNGFPETRTIVSVGFFKKNENTDFVFIHFYDSNNILRFSAYNVDSNSTLEISSFNELIVSNVTLDNILYIASQLAPSHNIEVIGIKSLLNMDFDSPYDDLKIMEFRDSYDLKNYEISDGLGFEDSTEDACGITHHCWSGGGSCHPFGGGCRASTCGRTGMNTFIQAYSTRQNYNLFNSALSENKSYQIRDELDSSNRGSFFVKSFYTISDHFNHSTDLELVSELISNINSYDEVLTAFNNDDNNFIVTDAHIESIKDVLRMSSDKSDSNVYKALINDITKISDWFKNKTINEIKQELSN